VPLVSVGDGSVAEGPSGTSTVTVTVSLSYASTVPVTVNWSLVDGSAIAGSDYTTGSGTVTFAPGETTKTISITVIGDFAQEADETFTVVLTSPSAALLGDASGAVTIRNDDVPAVLTVATTDSSAAEGSSTDTATFVVTRNGDLSQSLTVQLQWSGIAGFGIDYTVTAVGGTLDPTGATLTLAAGVASATLTVRALTDAVAEPAESLWLTVVANPAYGVGSPSSGSAVLQDSGALPTLSIADVSVIEGTKDGWVTITITLSQPSSSSVTVQVRTYDGTAKTGLDYKAVVTTVTFAPGQTSVTLQVRVLGDKLREGNETLTVQLSSPTGAVLARPVATVTILDDDGGTLLVSLSPPAGHDPGAPLSETDLARLAAAAIARWSAAGVPSERLAHVRFVIVDLPGQELARAEGETVFVDVDAAGWGWSLYPSAPEAGRVDLLTVLLHELGHVVGLEHVDHGLMASGLAPGTIEHEVEWLMSGHVASVDRGGVVAREQGRGLQVSAVADDGADHPVVRAATDALRSDRAAAAIQRATSTDAGPTPIAAPAIVAVAVTLLRRRQRGVLG